MLSSVSRQFIGSLVSVSLIAPYVTAARADVGARATISRTDYEACQTQDPKSFKSTIEQVTIKALERGLSHVDYNALVAAQWREARLDKIIDKQVDKAVDEVRESTSWGTLIKSLAYKEQAQKLATEVAERVYRSKQVAAAIEELAIGVGERVGGQIELATHDAATPAIKCLKAFLGPRYGETVAQVVSTDAHDEFKVAADDGGAQVSPGSVLKQSSGGLTGVAILLVRRQLANLARSVGQRLVGSILARLVSVVAGGIGVVLIAKDLWDLRHGVLPIIATEMKSAETKQKVREELANGLETQIADHVRQIGQSAADRIITIWHQFRSAHAKTLELAGRNDKYKQFVNETDPQRLARLDEITSLVLEREGEAGISLRLSNGTLYKAVAVMPEPAMTIARETNSLETAFQWNALAGDNIGAVTSYGIYRTAQPDEFTRSSLSRVLALNDRIAITRLAAIGSEPRETLLGLETPSLTRLAHGLNVHELETLAGYLTGLTPGPRQKILRSVAEQPGKMQLLASKRVRSAVLSSADQDAAVDMMLRADGTFDAQATLKNFQLAWNGKVSPVLIVDKHPIALTSLVIFALLLVLVFRRIFSTRPPASTSTPESQA